MKILVTGYKGYIGSHLYDEIKKDSTHEVYGIDLKDGNDVLYCLPDEGDARNTLANNQTLIDCGWKPKISLDEGLERCFNK